MGKYYEDRVPYGKNRVFRMIDSSETVTKSTIPSLPAFQICFDRQKILTYGRMRARGSFRRFHKFLEKLSGPKKIDFLFLSTR